MSNDDYLCVLSFYPWEKIIASSTGTVHSLTLIAAAEVNDQGLWTGYATGFALKKILKWMLIIVGFLAGMFFVCRKSMIMGDTPEIKSND